MLVAGINDNRSTCNNCTCAACSSVWGLPNCSRFYHSMHNTCTHLLHCTVHFLKFHITQCSAPSESHISLWSTSTLRQQSKNITAAQPLTGNSSNCGCDKHVKLPACCPQGRGQEDWRQKFQYQSVDVGTQHGMNLFFFPLALLVYLREEAFVLPRKLVDICEESTY